MTLKANYRTDIDGLRGMAVVFVAAYHFGVHRLPGGFVGVDIFFVISGFLITRIIYTESIAGDFSFVRFYERRVRRIVPALYALVAVVAVVSLFFLLPDEYVRFSQSALSVGTFSSNVLFWQESGYFAQASHGKPLLHTWSLAVEEQFYFVFPVVIYLLTRFDRRREFFWVAALCLASFGLNVWGVRSFPEATFYLAPARAWEFLLGSLLAVPGIPAPNRQIQRIGAVVVGLALMIASAVLFSSSTPFPGENALMPCLGAALFIWGNTGTEGQVPRNPFVRLFAFFGLISYSLYLWHWPVLIFYRRMLGTSPEYTRLNAYDKTALFAVSIALAYASYRFIEQPIRLRTLAQTRRSLFTGAAIASLGLLTIGGAGITMDGFPGRVDQRIAAIANFSKYRITELYESNRCFLSGRQKFSDLNPDCMKTEPNAKNLLVWGDSAAAHYIHGFRTVAPRGLKISHASYSACFPLYDFDRPNRPNCRAFNDGVRSFIETNKPDAVVLSAVWNVGMRELGTAVILERLRETVTRLTSQHIHIILLGPPIQYVDRLPYILSRYAMNGLDRFDSLKFINPEFSEIDALLRHEFGGLERVRYVSVRDAICKEGRCPAVLDGYIPMQWDVHHLTAEGSVLAAQKLMPEILRSLDLGRAN
jgi:peptidoglycan/LPS O-acetylase OafA/YrhL